MPFKIYVNQSAHKCASDKKMDMTLVTMCHSTIKSTERHGHLQALYFVLQVDPSGSGSIPAQVAAKFLKKSGLSDIILSRVKLIFKSKTIIIFITVFLPTDMGFIRSGWERLPQQTRTFCRSKARCTGSSREGSQYGQHVK